MQLSRLLLGLLLGASFLLAQDTVKIVKVRGDGGVLAHLACTAPNLVCRPTDTLKAIVLRGNADVVNNTEKIIADLDSLYSSPKFSTGDIETAVYVIAASTEPVEGVSDISGDPLTPVVKQLRSIFPYQHYQLLSSMLLRSSQDSSASSSGLMKSIISLPQGSQASQYSVDYQRATSNASGGIHFSRFQFKARVPFFIKPKEDPSKEKGIPYATTQSSIVDVGVGADLDLRENQKAVVGKANVSDSDTCFFIVVSARLVP